MAAIKALEQWCRIHCDGYKDVAITNMTTSFRNGLAFCALIHKYRPDLIDYDSLSKEDVFENNRLAFQVAEEKLGIPALLDAEDMVALRIPDRLSILTYVSQYYNYFNGRPPMGGVKRPAEGSKEEPSEKKNLPVVAKTFVPKAAENRLASVPTAQTSPKVVGTAAQKPVVAENANKNGTLNSKCVACKNHVHLVQRHFVEGKLYHRSCFKCSECSDVLHAGGYKPGRKPDTFICNAHQDDCKREAASKNGPAAPAGPPTGARASPKKPAPRPSSVLLAPVNVVATPVSPAPPSESWTATAQKTQSARQKFFQAAAPVREVTPAERKPAEVLSVLGRPRIRLDSPESRIQVSPDEEKSRAGTPTGKKLAEENRNNNNKRPFTVRSAERRFGDEPRSADSSGLRRDKSGQGPAGNWTGRPSTSRANKKEAACLNNINKDDTRPTTVPSPARANNSDVCPDDLPADPVHKRQSNLICLKTEDSRPKDAEAEAFPERHKPAFLTTATPSEVSASPARPPSAPAPPPTSALFYPGHSRDAAPKKPQLGSENRGVEYSHPPVKSPPRRPAVESISAAPRTAPANDGNPSGAKKGKYLSPTNASRTEMRSPSQVRSYHVPAEQIDRELKDIETSLAQLEKEGVELEKKLRGCEEDGEGDILMDPLMVDWFNLIRQKQMYIRKESELVYIARTQELEQQQPGVEGELRTLLEKPDHLKSSEEQQREKKLMQRLVEIVDGRNAIVEGLDEDRLREVEEDQQLNEMMKNLGVKKPKPKRTSSISKMFRRRSKRRVE